MKKVKLLGRSITMVIPGDGIRHWRYSRTDATNSVFYSLVKTKVVRVVMEKRLALVMLN